MQRLIPVPLASPSPSPKPTSPPDPKLVAHRLQERSISATTCGWVNGNASFPVTCSAGYSCFSFTSQSVHECCYDLQGCFPPTTCMDSTAYVTACNTSCQDDFSTLKCTSESSSYCYLQHWNGTLPMSQWGCANSPFTQNVESTLVGAQVSVTGSSGATPTASGLGSSPTDPTSLDSGSSSSSSLSTAEIVGIAIGSVVFLSIIMGAMRQLFRQKYSDAPKLPTDFPLQPTNYVPPPGPSPPGPHVVNNYYTHPTSPPPYNASSDSREYFGQSPHALSPENLDRLQSGYSDRGPRTVDSISVDRYSNIGDLPEFRHSPRNNYSMSQSPPSEISAPPQRLPPI